ncbi:hypothetical protein QBC43DRAFT_378163 [Cladorrhinum sp. PSN259]|nr:hypothetical protein QBC43DRAFT_378163 [Cladorrhinum sp. PSN259]
MEQAFSISSRSEDIHISLHCNNKACETELNDTMLVSICGHCICPECAIGAGFGSNVHFYCPACQAELSSAACHVWEQTAKPSPEWRKLALCGLNPTAIMEAAGEAVSFFARQMAGQLTSHAEESKRLGNVYNAEISKMFAEASEKLAKLHARVRNVDRLNESLRQKNRELEISLEDARHQFDRLQSQYDTMKNQPFVEPDSLGGSKFVVPGKFPRLVLPGHLRESQGHYFPSDIDYPDPRGNGGHLSPHEYNQAAQDSHVRHPAGAGTGLGDWNKGQQTSRTATKPPGVGITTASNFFPEHKIGSRAIVADTTSGLLRQTNPAVSQIQVQDTSRRFSGAQFGVTSSRAAQQTRESADGRYDLERRGGCSYAQPLCHQEAVKLTASSPSLPSSTTRPKDQYSNLQSATPALPPDLIEFLAEVLV